ncbi:MAG: hypothetical protein NTU83_01005 [Candidatus Hydrogenedentes bacterium]|nr:hypothetical protein [Candidatus Hydrogenedentota bacterium]
MHIRIVTKSRPASATTSTGTLDGLLALLQSLTQILGVLGSISAFINSLKGV